MSHLIANHNVCKEIETDRDPNPKAADHRETGEPDRKRRFEGSWWISRRAASAWRGSSIANRCSSKSAKNRRVTQALWAVASTGTHLTEFSIEDFPARTSFAALLCISPLRVESVIV